MTEKEILRNSSRKEIKDTLNKMCIPRLDPGSENNVFIFCMK